MVGSHTGRVVDYKLRELSFKIKMSLYTLYMYALMPSVDYV